MSPRIRERSRTQRPPGEEWAPRITGQTVAKIMHGPHESAKRRAEREHEERLDRLQAQRAARLEQVLAEPSRAEPSRAEPWRPR